MSQVTSCRKRNVSPHLFSAVFALAAGLALAATPVSSQALPYGAGEGPDYRGTPLSVYVDFDGTGSGPYASASLPSSPSVFTTFHDGNPDHWLYWDVPPSLTLMDADGGGHLIHVELPNYVDQLPEKHMRVHLWWTGLSDDLVFPEVIEILGISDVDGSGAGTAEHVGSSPVQPFTQPDGGYQYHDWILYPNPDWESVTIAVPQGIEIDRIVIDTVSIPEPATLGLLGAGMATLLLKRRRTA